MTFCASTILAKMVTLTRTPLGYLAILACMLIPISLPLLAPSGISALSYISTLPLLAAIAQLFLAILVSTLKYWLAQSPIQSASVLDMVVPPTSLKHQLGDGNVSACDARSHFNHKSFRMDKLKPDPQNQHPQAAVRRLAAVRCFQAWGKRYSLPIYDECMSRHSCRNGIPGSRVILDAKDACSYTNDDLRFEQPQVGHLVTHVDTFTKKDLDDANYTLSDGNIHAIYTWNPSQVAGRSDEISFRYEDGQFVCSGNGFADYKDRLFDFEDDNLVTQRSEWRMNKKSLVFIFAGFVYLLARVLQNQIYNDELINVLVAYIRLEHFTVFIHTPFFYVPGISIDPGMWNLLAFVPRLGFTEHRFDLPYYWPAEASFLQSNDAAYVLCMFVLAVVMSRHVTAYAHKVVRLDVGESRSIVVVIPNARFEGLAFILRPFLAAAALKYREPAQAVCENGHQFVVESRKDPAGYSVAYVGAFHSYFVPAEAVSMTKAVTTAKHAPSLSCVRLGCKAEGMDLDRAACAASIAISGKTALPSFSDNYCYNPVPTVCRPEPGVEDKPVMAHTAMTPIIAGQAFVHAVSNPQFEDLVERRLKIPHEEVDTTLTPELAALVREFAGFIQREVGHQIEPVSEEEYVQSRSKSQLAKFSTVSEIYDIDNLEMREGFPKREVLPDASKAARAICTFPPETQAKGGRITLAYAKALKSCKWLGCGLTPSELVDRILEVCADKDYVNETDFSAQDATIDDIKRVIELHFLLCLFEPCWHSMIRDWHYSDYVGAVRYGATVYPLDGSRGSGSPFTTMGNTPLTAFFAYVGYRRNWEPEYAWRMLGIYAGDDGLSPHLTEAGVIEASKLLGFKVKSKVSDNNIAFLGRRYHDPIAGSPYSISDPARFGKIHTTLLDTQQFTAEEAMLMKAMCYQVTDKNSDFLGEWSAKVLRDASHRQRQELTEKILRFPHLHPYFAVTALKLDETYPTKTGLFIQLIDEIHPDFDWSLFKSWLETGDGACPTLCTHPLDEGKLQQQAPVDVCELGVQEDSARLQFEKKSSKGEHKELLKALRKKGLLEDYRAAKHDPSASPDVNKKNFEIRSALKAQVCLK